MSLSFFRYEIECTHCETPTHILVPSDETSKPEACPMCGSFDITIANDSDVEE